MSPGPGRPDAVARLSLSMLSSVTLLPPQEEALRARRAPGNSRRCSVTIRFRQLYFRISTREDQIFHLPSNRRGLGVLCGRAVAAPSGSGQGAVLADQDAREDVAQDLHQRPAVRGSLLGPRGPGRCLDSERLHRLLWAMPLMGPGTGAGTAGRGGGSSCCRCLVFCEKRPTACGAGGVLLQPAVHALCVKEVAAGQPPHRGVVRKLAEAHGARLLLPLLPLLLLRLLLLLLLLMLPIALGGSFVRHVARVLLLTRAMIGRAIRISLNHTPSRLAGDDVLQCVAAMKQLGMSLGHGRLCGSWGTYIDAIMRT